MSDQSYISGHKALAAAVILEAIKELHKRKNAAGARYFLTHPDRRPARLPWLLWLGFSDEGFQDLLRREDFQGQKNKIRRLV